MMSELAGSEMAGDEVRWHTDTDTMRVGMRAEVKTADHIVHLGTIVSIDPGGNAFGLLRDDFERMTVCKYSWVFDCSRLLCCRELLPKAVQR